MSDEENSEELGLSVDEVLAQMDPEGLLQWKLAMTRALLAKESKYLLHMTEERDHYRNLAFSKGADLDRVNQELEAALSDLDEVADRGR